MSTQRRHRTNICDRKKNTIFRTSTEEREKIGVLLICRTNWPFSVCSRSFASVFFFVFRIKCWEQKQQREFLSFYRLEADTHTRIHFIVAMNERQSYKKIKAFFCYHRRGWSPLLDRRRAHMAMVNVYFWIFFFSFFCRRKSQPEDYFDFTFCRGCNAIVCRPETCRSINCDKWNQHDMRCIVSTGKLLNCRNDDRTQSSVNLSPKHFSFRFVPVLLRFDSLVTGLTIYNSFLFDVQVHSTISSRFFSFGLLFIVFFSFLTLLLYDNDDGPMALSCRVWVHCLMFQ